jgi:hypothetical protein
MSDQQPVEQASTASDALAGQSFADMSAGEKLAWLGKVVVMVFTGGFAFPNIFVE